VGQGKLGVFTAPKQGSTLVPPDICMPRCYKYSATTTCTEVSQESEWSAAISEA
jgi:hypothetical protein